MARGWLPGAARLLLLYCAALIVQAWGCMVGQTTEATRCLAVGRPEAARIILATYPNWTAAVPVLGAYRYEDAIALCPLPAEAGP